MVANYGSIRKVVVLLKYNMNYYRKKGNINIGTVNCLKRI